MPRASTGYLKLIGGVWHVRLSRGSGTQRARPWYSLGTADKRVAERRRKALVAKAAAGQDPQRAAREMPATPTVAEWEGTWTAKRRAQGIVSARDDEQRLQDYALPLIGEKLLGDVRPKHLADVLDEVVAAGRSRETVKHVKAALSRLFGAAWRAELITENPVAKVELPPMRSTKKRTVLLTDREFTTLIAYLDGRVSAADAWETEHGRAALRDGSRELRMLCACARILGGMRTSDANRWDWTQLDLVHFALVVVPREKTDEPQDLVVPVELRPIVRDWWERAGRPSSGPVFPARRGANAGGFKAARGISYAARLRRECRRAGLDRPELYRDTARTRRLDFHSFRRAFATALANAPEVSMQTAMKLTNHADPRTHLGYVAPVVEIPSSAVPRLASLSGQSSEDTSKTARHRGFEPLAFGSGGRRDGMPSPSPSADPAQNRAGGPTGSTPAITGDFGRLASIGLADEEGAAALALVGRQLLVGSLGWDALEAELVDDGKRGSR